VSISSFISDIILFSNKKLFLYPQRGQTIVLPQQTVFLYFIKYFLDFFSTHHFFCCNVKVIF
jgi:hypothetical protein